MIRIYRPTLKHVNAILFGAIIILDLYIVAAPFLPGLFARPQPANSSHFVQYQAKLESPPSTAAAKRANQVIIPAMQLDAAIYEGRDTYAELDKGVLRWPDSSTPDKGGNTVLLGHRLTYTNPRGVFYFLNVVKVGDALGLIWNNKTYTYKVVRTAVVPPTDTSILAPTAEPTLTIYTCTPIWWPKDRLVVTARLETHHE